MKRSAPSVQGARPHKPIAGFSKVFSWGVLITVFFPLVVYLVIGNYVRYFADDFATAGDFLRFGFWEAQIYSYLNWTGSYTYNFLTALAAEGGVSTARWLPPMILILWLILLYWLLDSIFRILKISLSKIWIAILSGVIVFCTIRGFNDYTQVIFWRTGIIAYLSNVLVFILILLYILNRFLLSTKRVRPWEYGVMLVAFLIAGGICETWIVMQVSLFAIGILVALLFRKKLPHDDLLKMLVVGFIASCLAFLITIMAPGNSNHSSTMDALSLQRIIKYLFVSFADVPWFLVEWVNRRTILASLITITGLIAGLYGNRQSDLDGRRIYLQFGGIMLVCACLMLWMGFFPGYTVFGVRPPDRAIFTAMFIFLMAYALFCFLIGWIVGSLLPTSFQNPVYVLLAFCLAVLMYVSPIQTAISQLKLIPILQLYAHLWDERDAFLRRAGEQGQRDVTIPSIRYHPDLGALKSTIWLVGELEEDPGNWKNNAASIYYGLYSITGQVNPPSYEFK